MITRDDLPETPDWLPESRMVLEPAAFDALVDALEQPPKPSVALQRAMKRHAECPAFVSQPLTWDGDNA